MPLPPKLTMLTDREIQRLIELPKSIRAKTPASGYREESGHKRCDLEFKVGSADDKKFSTFIRQHNKFIENFSIGLRYRTDDSTIGTVTLLRYNGAHGGTSRHEDGHFCKPHIHRITESEIASGSTHPQEKHCEITDRYETYEQALEVFFEDIAVSNHEKYFPKPLQIRLFNEP